jgi:hypothetical protein
VRTALAWLGCAVFAIPLMAHAYAGSGSRYFGDDFCASATFHEHGLIGGQRWFYMNWNAVPTTLFLMAVTDPAGVWITRVLPAVAIVLWVAAAVWAVRQVTGRIGEPADLPVSLLLAEIVVYATIVDAPNIVQSLYLRVPMLAYVAPLIALTLYAGCVARISARHQTTPGRLVASGVIGFVAGCFGPTYVAMQTTALALAAVLTRLLDRSGRSRTLGRVLQSGLIGSVAALAFVALAPGNAVRQQSFTSSPSVWAIVKWSVLSSVFMFARPVLPLLHGTIVAMVARVLPSSPAWLTRALDMAASPLTPLLLVGVSAWIAFDRPEPATAVDIRRARLVLIGSPILAFALVAACMAPSAYGLSAPPPPRALIIPEFVLVCFTMAWGYALGVCGRAVSMSNRRVITPLAVALACAAVWPPIASARTAMDAGASLRAWAVRWDDTDRRLRSAHERGERKAVVPAVDTIGGVGSIGPDPADWVNWCAARYYGFDTITGVAATR